MASGSVKEWPIAVSAGSYTPTASASNQMVTVANLTLQPGTWLVLSYIQLSQSGSGVYNHTLFCDGQWSSTVRSPEMNGGGSVNYAIITVPEGSTKTVTVSVYTIITCDAYGQYGLIRLQ